MFKEVVFFGVDQMLLLPPSLDTVVISILDRSEEGSRPRLDGFREVLTLQFEDTYEEVSGDKPGDWPDEPSDDDHFLYSQGPGERVPSLSDAKRIVEFLDRHHQTFEQLVLAVHCYAGISRSAAVASWASTRYWAPLGDMRSTDFANTRLVRLLNKAAGRH